MCLVSIENSGYHGHADLGKELQRSIVVQKLDGVVDDVALQRSPAQRHRSAVLWCRGWRTSPPLSRLMTG